MTSESVIAHLARIDARLEAQEDRLLQCNKRFAELDNHKLGPIFWARVLIPFALAAGGWVYTIAQLPNREEVRRMVQDHSPWSLERGPVMRVVNSYDADQKDTRDALEDIRENLVQINEQLKNALRRRR